MNPKAYQLMQQNIKLQKQAHIKTFLPDERPQPYGDPKGPPSSDYKEF